MIQRSLSPDGKHHGPALACIQQVIKGRSILQDCIEAASLQYLCQISDSRVEIPASRLEYSLLRSDCCKLSINFVEELRNAVWK